MVVWRHALLHPFSFSSELGPIACVFVKSAPSTVATHPSVGGRHELVSCCNSSAAATEGIDAVLPRKTTLRTMLALSALLHIKDAWANIVFYNVCSKNNDYILYS